MCIQAARVVVTFYLRLRNELQPYPTKNQASDWLTQLAVQPIRGLLFGGICLEFIYLYQIIGDYNFRVWCEKSCLPTFVLQNSFSHKTDRKELLSLDKKCSKEIQNHSFFHVVYSTQSS